MSTELPPGPGPARALASSIAFSRSPLEFMQRLKSRYGLTTYVHLFRSPPLAFMLSPEAAYFILVDKPELFLGQPYYQTFEGVSTRSLLHMDGEEHRLERRKLSRPFQPAALGLYVDVINECTDEFIESWPLGTAVNIREEMQSLTLRIISRLLLGVDIHREARDLGSAFEAVFYYSSLGRWSWRRYSKIPGLRSAWTAYLRGLATVESTIDSIIDQHRRGVADSTSIAAQLVATSPHDDVSQDRQVRDHIRMFLSAGHKTTSHLLTWALIELARTPRILIEVEREVQRVLGPRSPVLSDLGELVLLRAVVRETLRLYPPAWAAGRMAREPFDFEGYRFPAGQMVMFSQWITQRLPEVWGPSAERWDPHRFLKDTNLVPPTRSRRLEYFPFGAGPHICLGMSVAELEAMLILSRIIQCCGLTLARGLRVEHDPLIPPRPKDPVHLSRPAQRPVVIRS